MFASPVFTERAGRRLGWASRLFATVAVVSLLSLATAVFVVRGHAALVVVAMLVAIASVFVLRARENGVLAGTALIMLVPYWFTIGVAQANVMRVASALALGAIAALPVIQARRHLRFSLPDAAVAAFAAWALASWIISPPAANSVEAAVNSVMPLAFYVGGRLCAPAARWRVAWVMFIAALVATASLLIEFVTRAPLFVSRESYLWNADGDLIFRPGGVFSSPPAASAVLAMAFLIGLGLVAHARGSLTRWFVLVGLALILLGQVITFTRAGLIATAVGIVAYFAISRPASLWRLIGAGVLIALAATMLVLPRVSESLWFREGILREDNLAVRQGYWRDAWPLITNSPSHAFFGHGINSLSVGRPELPGEAHPDLAAAPTLLRIGPHNQYVRTLFELGFLGLACLAAWLIGTIAFGVRAARSAVDQVERRFAAAATSALGAFVLVGLVGDSLRNPPTFAIGALVAGQIVGQRLRQREP